MTKSKALPKPVDTPNQNSGPVVHDGPGVIFPQAGEHTGDPTLREDVVKETPVEESAEEEG